MAEILDEPFNEENNQTLGHHSRQAYFRLLISIALAVGGVFIFIIGMLFNAAIDISFIMSSILIVAVLLSWSYNLSGLANAILSFYKKEANHPKKWMALFGNLCFPLVSILFLFILNFQSLS